MLASRNHSSLTDDFGTGVTVVGNRNVKRPSAGVTAVFCALLIHFLSALTMQAHSPFESSTRAIVNDDRLEIALTVGLEVDVVLKFPRQAGNALAVRAVFLDQLPADFNSSFVMTDESGNIFAAKVLSRKDAAVGLTLPALVTATETEVVGSVPSAPAKNPVATAQPVSPPASQL